MALPLALHAALRQNERVFSHDEHGDFSGSAKLLIV
jgi:hypothetical protein